MKAFWAPLEETKTEFFRKEKRRTEHTRGLLWFYLWWCLGKGDGQGLGFRCEDFSTSR